MKNHLKIQWIPMHLCSCNNFSFSSVHKPKTNFSKEKNENGASIQWVCCVMRWLFTIFVTHRDKRCDTQEWKWCCAMYLSERQSVEWQTDRNVFNSSLLDLVFFCFVSLTCSFSYSNCRSTGRYTEIERKKGSVVFGSLLFFVDNSFENLLKTLIQMHGASSPEFHCCHLLQFSILLLFYAFSRSFFCLSFRSLNSLHIQFLCPFVHSFCSVYRSHRFIFVSTSFAVAFRRIFLSQNFSALILFAKRQNKRDEETHMQYAHEKAFSMLLNYITIASTWNI